MFVFDEESLLYFLKKIKENFAVKKDFDNKVDKVSGKDLTTNNFTNAYASAINTGIDDIDLIQDKDLTTISFYSTTIEGVKTKIKDISLDI